MSFLDALIYGIRDVQAAGVAIARRSILNFGADFTATDNSAQGRSDIALSGTVSSGTTTWGASPTSQIVSMSPASPVATTNATLTTVLTYPMPASTVVDFMITVVGIRTGGSSGTAGDSYRADFPVCYQRIASAGPTLVGAAAVETGKKSNGGGSAYAGSVAVSGNNILVQVTGVATTNIDWTAVIQGQQVA